MITTAFTKEEIQTIILAIKTEIQAIDTEESKYLIGEVRQAIDNHLKSLNSILTYLENRIH